MKIRHFFILGICVFNILTTTAQITVQGIVCDSNQKRLPFVTITATFAQQKAIAAFAFTDNEGAYQLNIPKKIADSLTVSASSMGFAKVGKNLILENNKTTYKIDFQLNTEKLNLPALLVNAEALNKVVKNDTTTFKVKFYIDSTERVLEDVLKKLPGINVKSDGTIEYKGKPVERILIEGDDLFNANTKIPSKNLHASLIEEVQVIDNYSNNTLLKNIENSERQVINLSFKKDRKKAFFGNINAGGGFTNRYEANTNLISFVGKTKLFGLGGLNNIGNNLGSNGINSDRIINRLNNPDYFDPSVEAANFIPIPRLSAPNLPDKNVNINQIQQSSINFLTRPTKGWTFKAIGLLSKDRIWQTQNSINQYLLGSSQFTVAETAKAQLKPNVQNFHIENTIPLSKTANLKLVNEYHNDKAQAFSTIDINGKNITQQLNTRAVAWRNLMSFTMKVSDSAAIVVEGAYIWNKRPQELTLIPKENYVSLINQPQLNFTAINQNVQVGTEYGGFVARLVKVWRGEHKINFSIGGSMRQDTNFSVVFTENHSEKQIFQDVAYINKVKYRTQDFFASASYNKEFGKVNFASKLTLIQRRDKLEDAIANTHNFTKNWLYPSPRFSIKRKMNQRSSIAGTYSYKANFANLEDVSGSYIFRNYRQLNRSNVMPYRINNHSFSSTYRFDYPKKRLEGYISLMYFIDDNARSSRYTFTPFLVLSETTNQQRNNKTYMANTQIMRLLPRLNLSLKLETSHNILTFYNGIGNSNIEKNTQMTNMYLMQLVSTYSGIFDFIGGFSFTSSKQYTQTNSQSINPRYIQQQIWFKTTWQINKKLFFNINNEYTTFQSTFGKNKNQIFTDITGQYEIKPSKLYLYFDIYNLFNTKTYTFTSINVNQIAVQNYNLLPRMQVLKCEWRF